MLDSVRYAREQRGVQLLELKDFLRIPSVSTQPSHDDDVHAAANWLADKMAAAGLENAKVIQTEGHPLVYGDWLHAGSKAPIVLVYGHYDVQPAEPFNLWSSPPFQPEIRDEQIYARGASDDKGQLYIHIKAVEAYLKTSGRLPVNVKFIIEGEEESGGASLESFIQENRELLAADVALISDTAMINRDQPAIVYGLRGMLYSLLQLTGPGRDLHSGSFGGGINNPLNVLGHIIAKLRDEDGRILIPGFYDRVRALTAVERDLLAGNPFDEEKWLAESGAPQLWGEPEYTLAERLGARPTLDVHGINGGYTGVGGKTVLPSKVHAKISMRLVPDQDPDEIATLFRQYLNEITPPSVKLSIEFIGSAPASITDFNISAMQAAKAAYTDVFGRQPLFIREGGTIPVVSQFQNYLGLETVLMGFGLPDDKIHAPNEKMYLPNFYRGIETSIHFFHEYRRSANHLAS
ncbi:MAG: dipeptidase [Candidatus Promineifilaceae bacterium]|nr:dipeptidase [Candidatus Promineifilaceae bacterium]